MIDPGTIAPLFTLPAQNGTTFRLDQYVGNHNVLLLFLPAAFTPICTTELPALASLQDQFWHGANTVVAAVTADLPAANREWARKCGAGNMFVLSDQYGDVSKGYGAWIKDENIPDRASVLIGADGKVKYAESVGKFGKRSVPALLTVAHAANGSKPSPIQSVRMPLDLPVLYVTTTCPHCHAVMGVLKGLYAEDKVVVRWVDQERAAMKSLLEVEPQGLVPLLWWQGQRFVGENEIQPQLQAIAGQ